MKYIDVMLLIQSCEKCNYRYEIVAFTKPDGTTDGQTSKCPRCMNWNGRGSMKDNIREMYKKMGQEEPKFYD